MKMLDLFSGIGGFSYAAQQVWGDELEIVAFVENNKFCQKVLKKHWPNVPIIEDIKDVTWENIVQNVELMKRLGITKKENISLIANLVKQSDNKNGEQKTKTGETNRIEITIKREKQRLFPFMEVNALVAEKIELNSLPLTTNTIMEMQNDENINHKHGNSLSKTDFQITTKSYATTATMRNSIMEFAHTKGAKIDLLSAGIPCQPASCAGKQRGSSDNRWLWPEAFRVIKELQPTWCIIENVKGLLTLKQGMEFESLLLELESYGYETETYIIPACGVDAPHRRDRIWIIAKRTSNGFSSPKLRKFRENNDTTSAGQKDAAQISGYWALGEIQRVRTVGYSYKFGLPGINWRKYGKKFKNRSQDVADTMCRGQQGQGKYGKSICKEKSENGKTNRSFNSSKTGWENWLPEPKLGRVAHGIPNRVDRLKSLGNAIVPQVVIPIMQAIKEIEDN